MQRFAGLFVAAAILVLAGYLYLEAQPHPTVTPAPATGLVIATPIARFEKGTGENLAAARSDFSGGAWEKDRSVITANAGLAPDGSGTAARLAETFGEGRHRIETSVRDATPGDTYTLSVFVKPAGRQGVIMEMRDEATGGKYGSVTYDLLKKTLVTQKGDIADAGLQELPDGWFRIWAAMPYTSATVVFDIGLIDGTSVIYRGTGSGDLIWGVQFEPGKKPGGYNDAVAQSAGHPTVTPTPESSHVAAAPVANFAKGTGINLAAEHSDFNGDAWEKEGSAVTPNAGPAPDGSNTAARLAETLGQGRHRIETTVKGATPGDIYTLSVFVKPAGRQGVIMEMRDGPAGGKYGSVTYDLAKKMPASRKGDIADAGLQELADGWFRVWAAMPYTSATVVFDIGLIDGSSVTYPGDGSSGGLIWGVQFEPSNRPGGYSGVVAQPPK